MLAFLVLKKIHADKFMGENLKNFMTRKNIALDFAWQNRESFEVIITTQNLAHCTTDF